MTDAHEAGDPRSPGSMLRAPGAATIGWIAVGAATLIALLILVQIPPADAVVQLGLPALLAAVGWACYLRPHVRLEPGRAIVVNLLRTHDLPLARIAEVERRLGVTLVLDDARRIGVWALPHTGRRVRRIGLRGGSVEPHTAEPVQALLDAHAQVRTRASSAGQEQARTRLHWGPALLCAAAALWAVTGLGVVTSL